MNTCSVITGKDLIKHKGRLDLAPGFLDQIDPEGFNLITMEFLHSEIYDDMRLVMMFKLINREEGFDGTLTINRKLLNLIRKQFILEDENE